VLFADIFNRENEELLVICDWLLGEEEEATSSPSFTSMLNV
jgi:hypothetical protein